MFSHKWDIGSQRVHIHEPNLLHEALGTVSASCQSSNSKWDALTPSVRNPTGLRT